MRRLAPALAALIPLTAACGDDDSSTATEAPSVSSPATGAAAAFNDADVLFAQQMIPHHEQAVEMADIALDHADSGARAEVVDLATRIREAQPPEIEQMTGWLREWGQEPTADTAHEMSTMDGEMTDEEMGELRDAGHDEFDRMWMEMMIAHHEGAIEMSETEQRDGTNPEAVALADQIITAQQAEIDEMRQLLDG